MDATDCPIKEPSPFDRKWYSHKLNGPGLKYEIGLNIRNGNIIWVNGGLFCGQYSDFKLARDEYTSSVSYGELTIADDTYKDRRFFIYPSANPESRTLQKKIMARHETVNSRLKQYVVLFSAFHHPISLHRNCFHAVANITQLMIENG